ncbi:MAG: peptide chain release factor N(5)-glutamine methyltransferase [Anaerovoracaceae bacterium]|nr:peptide chain release factor N(5)-glutamine methyltransferase [Anaerovoracaceae bacterium]
MALLVKDLIRMALTQLTSAGVPDAKHDAEAIYCNLMHVKPDRFFMEWSEPADDRTTEQYLALIDRRRRREPLQYITGEQGFLDFTLHAAPGVLIPRLDTEPVALEAAEMLKEMKKPSALDLCCGSGAIAVAASKLGGAEVTACDISEEAVKLTRENAQLCGANVSVIRGDMFAPVKRKKFDMIISNPPYIRSGDIDGLMPEVRDYEPRDALDGGEDGLDFYRLILEQAPAHIKDDGWLILEIGDDQAADVCALIEETCKFDPPEVKQDLAGHDRIVKAQLPGKAVRRQRAKDAAAAEKKRAKEEAAAEKQRKKDEAEAEKKRKKEEAEEAKRRAKEEAIEEKKRKKEEKKAKKS